MSDDATIRNGAGPGTPPAGRGGRPLVNPPAAQLLGRRVISYDAEAGRGAYVYVARPEFCNRHGTVQGGILAAMLDSATGFTLIESLPDGLTAVTRDLNTRFLKPASPGEIFAEARVTQRDERGAHVEGELRSPDGVTLATAVAVMRFVRRG
ncbi:PaaI family thioesterase [Camelimonas sp. ID_303_24]